MKFIDKAKELRPYIDKKDFRLICPQALNLETKSECPADEGCIYCWNREVPEDKKL